MMFSFYVYGFAGGVQPQKYLERDGIMASTDEHDEGENLR
jgi:hypothetical protein